MRSAVVLVMLLALPVLPARAQDLLEAAPFVGAQVFIEPGQTPEAVDGWFRVMSESGLRACRIRMFEAYMRRPGGDWDFSLFDRAFAAADKYHIRVFATLFPATPFTDIGGFKFPRDEAHLGEIADYIRQVTTHFKQYTSLYAWVLINEPGVGGRLPAGAFTEAKFAEWRATHPTPAFNERGYPVVAFEEERFLLDYNTWFLDWIAGEVRRHDPGRHLHVNNHQIFQNAAEYDFPAWRRFLTSLGGSAHASWHFGYFRREQYAVAMLANSAMIRSGAGPLPWLMTELQGGNNLYSGFDAMCPTREEIAQWLWTVVGSGGRGSIFWTLNPRASGGEAGEWALLNFQHEPSDRLVAAAAVSRTLSGHAALFAAARPLPAPIHVLYTRESLWTERRAQIGGPAYEGREVGGVMKSALGFVEALAELGVAANLGAIDEFDFSGETYRDVTLILAHQVALPTRYRDSLQAFVARGGKLIVEGLTGFYDQHMHNVVQTGFPFRELFGGNLREVTLIGDAFDLTLDDPRLTLPAHLWRGTLQPAGGAVLGAAEEQPVALRHRYGAGEVVWTPSLLGLGARRQDYGPLLAFLEQEAAASLAATPFRFRRRQPGMLMLTMRSGDDYVTILINKSNERREVLLETPVGLRSAPLFADQGGGLIPPATVRLHPEETAVVVWRK